MTALVILAALSIVGIGAAVWIFKNEDKAEAGGNIEAPRLNLKNEPVAPLPEITPENLSDRKERSSVFSKLLNRPKKEELPETLSEPEEPQPEPKETSSVFLKIANKLNFSGLMDKLRMGKKGPGLTEGPETVPLPSLKDFLEEEKRRNQQNETPTGTASLTTTPTNTPTEEKILPIIDNTENEAELNLKSQLDELQEKYNRLDGLFKEKGAELTSAQESLQNEINNRTEFNKVKDLLEKELKETKEKARSMEGESQNINKEIETYQSRAKELEEKVSVLENQLKEKEAEVNDLVKRLQTFASPTTAATPPKEETRAQEPISEAQPEDKKPIPEAQPQDEEPIPEAQPEDEKPEPLKDTASETAPEKTEEPPSKTEASEQIKQEETPPAGDEQKEPKFVLNLDGGEDSDSFEEHPINDESSTHLSGPSEEKPPEPYEEPIDDDDEPMQEHSFLKLQPDIIEDEPAKSAPSNDTTGPEESTDPQQDTGPTEGNPTKNDQTKE